MNDFERPSIDEIRRLARRLRDKTVEEIIAALNPPTTECGTSQKERRYAGGRVETVRFSRTVEFSDVTPTIHRLLVRERTDGKLEFEYRGHPVQPSGSDEQFAGRDLKGQAVA